VRVCVHDDSSPSPRVIHKQTPGLARRPHVGTPYVVVVVVGVGVVVIVVVVMFKLLHLVEICALMSAF